MSRPDLKLPRFLQTAPVPSGVASFAFVRSTAAEPPASPAPAPAPAQVPEQEQVPAPRPAPAVDDARREALGRVAEALRSFSLEAERLAEQARGDSIEIGFLVASRILETEARSNPEAIFSLVRSALRKAGDSRRVVLRVSPGDAAVLEASRERLGDGVLAAARVEISADASLGPGDCLVETDFGQVDGRLATRLAEAKRTVKATVDGGAA
jgi:flagellar assembly protein FliH